MRPRNSVAAVHDGAALLLIEIAIRGRTFVIVTAPIRGLRDLRLNEMGLL